MKARFTSHFFSSSPLPLFSFSCPFCALLPLERFCFHFEVLNDGEFQSVRKRCVALGETRALGETHNMWLFSAGMEIRRCVSNNYVL